ncbi:jg3495 [Pararge aegeria aegeria]|uniref:Jg3495 protein n=1 Tax=Pararge aegeria aegeria TaxID=348720 RepID=A0A8S4SNX7_9NEOP|nr:jg3495 [Pararge aegeria aegeria]
MGCYGVSGGVGRARELAMRRAPGLDDIGGKVGDVDPMLPPARTRTSARYLPITTDGLLRRQRGSGASARARHEKSPRARRHRGEGGRRRPDVASCEDSNLGSVRR